MSGWGHGADLMSEPAILAVDGVLAAGDVRLDFMKRVMSAVGEGAMPVYFVHRYLATI
jgi:thioredoxin reductase (NADPH)